MGGSFFITFFCIRKIILANIKLKEPLGLEKREAYFFVAKVDL
ncbi:hypothetical protein RV00_GL001133 [Enterococcus devriesei]|uniref:Uncharacterized protein n=1 Tax=Enterococcus devriesei TaxID=319970 RepID=A0A1L8SXK8_9ENTE|nr:hypothetical protein RV00_GL001133 [Enterococcus devriesei]